MATPGQNNTTLTTCLNQIVAVLSTVDTLNNGNVFIAADPVFLGTSYMGDRYVEVVPGANMDKYAPVGSGYQDDSVSVYVYYRLLLDQADMDTRKLADSSIGLLALMDTIDDSIINHFLGGLLLQPMMPKSREPWPQAAAGWAGIRRVYNFRYRTTYPNPQGMTS